MKPSVLIRADGNSKIGLGHLVRCSALALMLKDNFTVSFFCREIPESLQNDLKNSGFDCKIIGNENEFLTKAARNNIVVLDGYNFDTNYQKLIKKAGSKIVCIDDLHDKVFLADLIINYTPGIKPSDYVAQCYTQFALGLDYALLRPVFIEQAKKQHKIVKIETLMICLGGSDPKGITKHILEIVVGFLRFKKIIVITGSAYLITDDFRHLVGSDPRVQHRHDLKVQQMINTMMESDLAIVSASGILLETICCGCIPVICYYADNQKEFHSYMSKTVNLNSFGDNSDKFQSESLISQINDIKLNNNLILDNLRGVITGTSENILNLFSSFIL